MSSTTSKCLEAINMESWRVQVADVTLPCGPNATENGTTIVTTCQGEICTCKMISESRGVNAAGLVAIAFFYLLILSVGLYAAWKNKRSSSSTSSSSSTTTSSTHTAPSNEDGRKAAEEVMLANRSLSLPVGIMTMTATWVGGGFINGAAEIVYASGLAWCQAPFGFSVSLLLGGIFFAKRMRAAGYVTMLDPFQHRFGRVLGGLLFLPALTGEIFWSSAILSALGSTLSVIVDWDRNFCVIISASIAIGYTLFGGLLSVAYTDVVQLVCIAMGLVLAVPFAANHAHTLPISETYWPPSTSSSSSSSSSISYQVNATMDDLDPRSETGWKGSVDHESIGPYIDTYLLLMFGGIPWQVYFQRVLSAKTASYAQQLSFIASLGCLLMVIPPILLGAVAFSTDWTKIDGLRRDFVFTWNKNHTSSYSSSTSSTPSTCDTLVYKGYTQVGVADRIIQPVNQLTDSSIVLPLTLQYLTPTWVAFIGLGAVSAAVMSSTDSSILGVSSMFARNVYQQIFRPSASQREITWVIRISIVVAGSIALGLGLTVKSVYGLFHLCADFVYVILFPQLVAVVYLPFVNAYGSIAAYFIGALLRIGGGEHLEIGGETVMHLQPFIFYPGYDEEKKKQLFPFRTFTMLISFLLLLLVSYFSRLLFLTFKIDPKYDFGNALPKRSQSDLCLFVQSEESIDPSNEELSLRTVNACVNYGMTDENIDFSNTENETQSERF